MFRFLSRTISVLLLSAMAAGGLVLWRSHDPLYTVQEWLNFSRFSRYDAIIAQVGRKQRVDPMLIKAVIWRESSFHPDKVGKNGERGLMQVTEAAAKDWARIQKDDTFVVNELFDPRKNIEVGTWYLKQALQRWSAKDDPIPFALAEYNAGKKRVDRWIDQTNMGEKTSADDLRESISFKSTRGYVDSILGRYKAYKAQSAAQKSD